MDNELTNLAAYIDNFLGKYSPEYGYSPGVKGWESREQAISSIATSLKKRDVEWLNAILDPMAEAIPGREAKVDEIQRNIKIYLTTGQVPDIPASKPAHVMSRSAAKSASTKTASWGSNRIEKEAQRVAAELKNLKEPNSPSKTHFMVKLSPQFILEASSKDTDRLRSMLPYQSLSFSTLKEERGIFAFVAKEEKQDQPLRKIRSASNPVKEKGKEPER